MGIFNLFSSSGSSEKKQSELNWIPLESLSQLDEIESLSAGKKVLIFKHSTRCGISSMVLKMFKSTFKPDENKVLYYLDLLNHRNISNEIADRFGVTHQSPQLLVIENGSCINHGSHHQILSMI